MNTGYNITDVMATISFGVVLTGLIGAGVVANCLWIVAAFAGLALVMMVIT